MVGFGTGRALAWLALIAAARAVPYDLQGRGAAILPSDDAFYAVPADAGSSAPGAILKHRTPPAQIAAFGLAPVNLQSSHQILYRTNDNFGNATATVVTVLIPHNADRTKILSYQVAQDSSSKNCAPSYALQLASASGGPLGTLVTQAELLLIEAALERGWVVILPDHEGPTAAFLANRQAGQATLDGIRAALGSGSFTGIAKDAAVAMWGYSGGSLASAWAAELQPSYAPELKIAGAALGGTVPNITTVLSEINKSLTAGIIASGFVGLSNQYPQVNKILEQHVLPKYQPLFNKVRNQCLVADILDFLFKDVLAMLDDPTLPFTDPELVRIQNDNAPGQVTPKIPLYVYKSTGDELSPIGETDALVNKYCKGGASVKYVRDALSDHGTLAITGAAKALSWLIDVLDEGKPQKGCSTSTVVSSLLDPSTLEIIPGFLIDALLNLLGKPIGPILIG
ncbi:lipase, secreted [Trichoderma arundinaceum]|uniref:Lipase, secreted n=1 Tax=Trichoderma arundinaceum TaxID=490622 RepID=A0A395NPC6_TRIAR|nr:lipase, secreted [Trichoderma arundinaceum]